MKVYIVVLLVLVAVAADVDKRLFLPKIGDLVNTLNVELASHFVVTMSVCEDTCHRYAGTISFLCSPACELVIQEHKPSLINLVNELKSELASQSYITTSVCEAVCHHVTGLQSFWCPSACDLVVSEMNG